MPTNINETKVAVVTKLHSSVCRAVVCMMSVTAATELVTLHGIVPMTALMVSVAPEEEREGVGAAVEGEEEDDMGLAAEAGKRA